MRAIVVHDFEQALDANHASGSPGLDLVPEQLDQRIRAHLALLAGTAGFSSSLGLLLAEFSGGLRRGLLWLGIASRQDV